MKSERRHDLQQNSLVRGIENLPSFWRESGSKIALAAIVALLAFALVRLWYTNRTEKIARVAGNLSVAQDQLSQLRGEIQGRLQREQQVLAQMPQASFTMLPPEQFNQLRSEARDQIVKSTDEVLRDSTDAAQQAEAKVIRADLNYYLSLLGEQPEATTRPQTQFDKKPAELLDAARQDYEAVVGQAGSLPAMLVARSHFGLAAVAEDKSEWPAARTHYEAVEKSAGAPVAMVDLAKRRLALLPKIEAPILVAQPRQPETRPASLGPEFTPLGPVMPSTTPATSPGTLPATTPTTIPLAPSSVPATGPTTAPAGL